jgi:hypothetical protein
MITVRGNDQQATQPCRRRVRATAGPQEGTIRPRQFGLFYKTKPISYLFSIIDERRRKTRRASKEWLCPTRYGSVIYASEASLLNPMLPPVRTALIRTDFARAGYGEEKELANPPSLRSARNEFSSTPISFRPGGECPSSPSGCTPAHFRT